MNDTGTIAELRRSLDESPMRRGQFLVILLVVLLAGLDGYDVQSMSFVAPVVSNAWGMGKATLGLVLASGLFGMAGGSLAFAPLADVLGRRSVVLGGLLLMTFGSLLSAVSSTAWELAATRVVTGLGIGTLVPLTTAIAAEFSSARHRGLAVAVTTVGFSLGGVTGGLVAAAILKAHAWSWVFNVGAIAGAVLFILAAVGLPESPAYLIDRTPLGALIRLNRVLLRIG